MLVKELLEKLLGYNEDLSVYFESETGYSNITEVYRDEDGDVCLG